MPEPDKSIGQKILSFFVKDAEPTVATGTPPAPVPVVPRPAPKPEVSQPAYATTSGTVDPKFAEHFANVLAQNNPPGPDYFEFRETLRSLAHLGLTEDKQYQAAWASFKALGGASDIGVLTRTANQYITALNNDREAFGKSVEAALSERVGGLQNEQKRLEAENENLTRQLAEIQQKIKMNTDRLQGISGEISEQSSKITQNRQNYDVTFAHFADQIKDDINKITQYLK